MYLQEGAVTGLDGTDLTAKKKKKKKKTKKNYNKDAQTKEINSTYKVQ